ncbi:MAG: putative taurine transport system permease protein [Hyphomicrobiales bacterium]|jgi:ABC-type nitrate/sulfonate/bicarbonate transport system permease component|nr:putative taurine transport system permease protein [Hyphomicrobiales bacterium]
MTNAVQKARTTAPSFRIQRETVERLLNFASPVFLLLIWEIAAQAGFIDVRFFPAPSKIFDQLIVLAKNGSLWINFWASMQRLIWGFLFGGVPALILGVTMGLNRTLRMVVEPLISATYPIPKSAILPLVLLICGLGEASKIVMVAIGIFYPIVINSMAGVLEINKIHFDVSRNFGASRWQVFRTVALPGAMPLILTGVRLGIGLGLVLISLAEIVGAKSGLGYMMWNAWEILSVETMYVGLLVIAILGIAFSLAITELERFIVPWKRGR